MTRLILLSGCLALAACTTTVNDLKAHGPSSTYATAKPAEDVAGCLAEKVNGAGSPSVYRREGTTFVSFRQAAATTLLFSIEEGGQIEVRRVNGFIPYRKAIEECS